MVHNQINIMQAGTYITSHVSACKKIVKLGACKIVVLMCFADDLKKTLFYLTYVEVFPIDRMHFPGHREFIVQTEQIVRTGCVHQPGCHSGNDTHAHS